MRQAELNNWSLEPTQIADLCSSINQFFARTGVIQPQGAVQPPVCHGSMHTNKPSQHLNTGETAASQPFGANRISVLECKCARLCNNLCDILKFQVIRFGRFCLIFLIALVFILLYNMKV